MRKISIVASLLILFFFLKNDLLLPDRVPFPISEISIGEDGKANLNIPIDLPPGTKDLIPKLSLTYDSGNGNNGLLGVGWNLEGLPVIVRDPEFSIQYDGKDHYLSSLGGQMVLGVDGFYYHRKENFTRLQPIDICGSGPCKWLAVDSSGTKYYFGFHTTSQVPTIESSLALPNSIRVWALSEVRDLFGNGYTIQYTQEANGSYYPSFIEYNNRKIDFSYENKTSAEQKAHYVFGSKVIETKRLKNISIKVNGTEIQNYSLGYDNASSLGVSRLTSLSKIGYNSLTFSNNSSSNSASYSETSIEAVPLINQVRNPLPKYNQGICLGYMFQCKESQLPVCVPPPYTKKPCLSQFEHDTAKKICIEYLAHQQDWCLNGNNVNLSNRWIIDIDGDGKSDFASLSGSQDSGTMQVSVYRNLDSGKEKADSISYPLHVNVFTQMADMDGDLKTDFVHSDGGTLKIAFSNGTTFGTAVDTKIPVSISKPNYFVTGYFGEDSANIPKIYLGDIDGDGRADVVQKTVDGFKVSLSRSVGGVSSFLTSDIKATLDTKSEDSFIQLIDMNGDGRVEYVSLEKLTGKLRIIYFDSYDPKKVVLGNYYLIDVVPTENSLPTPQGVATNDPMYIVGNTYYEGSHWLADVNGDGKMDYTYIRENDANVCVNLFDGKEFISQPCVKIPEATFRDIKYRNMVFDVNGDGMADFVSYNATGVHVSLSNGTSFIPETGGKPFFVANTDFYAPADINGDGKIDFLHITIPDGATTGKLSIKMNNTVSESSQGNDLLIGVNNEFQSYTVNYKHKKFLANATNQSVRSYPVVVDNSPEYLAVSNAFKYATGFSAGITKSFSDKRIYLGTANARASLGFGTITTTNTMTGLSNTSVYNQDHYRTANAIKTSSNFNLNLQPTSISTYSYKQFGRSVIVCESALSVPPCYTNILIMDQTKTDNYKNGEVLYTVTNFTRYDLYGNPDIFQENIGSSKAVTFKTYEAPDKENWILNRLNNVKQYSNDILNSEQSTSYSGNSVASASQRTGASQWVTTTFSNYDSFGNPTTILDSNGSSTSILYDSILHKFPIEVTNALGHKIKSTYDLNTGNVLTKTDQNNAVTVNEYDNLGRLVYITYPGSGGWNEQYEYLNVGNPDLQRTIKTVRELNTGMILKTTQFLDGLGRLTKKESTGVAGSYLITEFFTYSSNGTLFSKTLPYQAGLEPAAFIKYTYNADLNVTEVEMPDGRSILTSNSGRTFTTQEKKNGVVIREANVVKDELGQITSKTVQGQMTSYLYDVAGRVSRIDSPEGGITTYTYDFAGRKTSQTDKSSGTYTYQYNNTGNLTSQTDANGNTITMEYDVLGRPTRKVKPEGEVTYTYDENNYLGKLTKVVDDSGITELKYDSVGRMIERKTKTDGPEVIFRYEYDTLSRMKKMYYPDGTATNNIYAPSGHLNQITMDSRDGSITGSPVVTYELDLTGGKNQIARITGNEVRTNINFDRINNRVLDYQTTTKSGILADNQVFTYDDSGNITKVNDLKSPALTMNYTYDNLDRLVSSQQGSLSTPVAYQYSPSGNLLKKGNIDYTYNAGSQPNAVKTAAVNNGTFTNTYFYTYDANGNMVRRNGADATSGDRMTYDSENRLTKIEDDSGNEIAKYFYDNGGQRTKKVLKDGSIVYEFGGMYEIAIPNGKPQQQTIYVRGLQGEIVAQMTDPGATLVTSADIESNERYALNTFGMSSNVSSSLSRTTSGIDFFLFVVLDFTRTDISSTIKHFINRHVVLNSKLLFQDHSSFAYILGGNRLSDKTRITAVLLFLMFLFYLAFKGFTTDEHGLTRIGLVTTSTKHNDRTVRLVSTSTPLGINSVEPPTTRYNPFITFSTPLILTMFLMTFSLGGCMGLSNHSGQTPWGALGIGIAATTPTLGAGGSTPGFGAPGQGGGSTGSGSGGEGTPVAGMFFFHRDQVGSTRLMTNSAGEMVAGSNGATNIVYNPYGDIDVDHSHGPDILRNKFTGQQLDNESGLYYYNARYYDPALGRFITADSVIDSGGANGMNRYIGLPPKKRT